MVSHTHEAYSRVDRHATEATWMKICFVRCSIWWSVQSMGKDAPLVRSRPDLAIKWDCRRPRNMPRGLPQRKRLEVLKMNLSVAVFNAAFGRSDSLGTSVGWLERI